MILLVAHLFLIFVKVVILQGIFVLGNSRQTLEKLKMIEEHVWSILFAWEEVNFHQNRTESQHDSMCKFSAAAQFEFQPPEKNHAAAQFSTTVLCHGTIANRIVKTHNTELLGF